MNFPGGSRQTFKVDIPKSRIGPEVDISYTAGFSVVEIPVLAKRLKTVGF